MARSVLALCTVSLVVLVAALSLDRWSLVKLSEYEPTGERTLYTALRFGLLGGDIVTASPGSGAGFGAEEVLEFEYKCDLVASPDFYFYSYYSYYDGLLNRPLSSSCEKLRDGGAVALAAALATTVALVSALLLSQGFVFKSWRRVQRLRVASLLLAADMMFGITVVGFWAGMAHKELKDNYAPVLLAQISFIGDDGWQVDADLGPSFIVFAGSMLFGLLAFFAAVVVGSSRAVVAEESEEQEGEADVELAPAVALAPDVDANPPAAGG